MLLHYVNFTWKFICAFIPPVGWKSAYPAFLGSLFVLVGVIYILIEVSLVNVHVGDDSDGSDG